MRQQKEEASRLSAEAERRRIEAERAKWQNVLRTPGSN